MAEITWLASFPKSGNTWMRILMSNYRENGDEPVDINRLSATSMASSRLWFDEWVGIEASLLPDRIVERLRPHAMRLMATREPGPLVVKIHDSWHVTDIGETLVPTDVTAGVIYLVRHPFDVALSNSHHYGESLAESVQRLLGRPRRTPAADSTPGTVSDQLPVKVGSWAEHVSGWLDSGMRTCVIRYEDLRADPIAEFTRVVEFMNWDLDHQRIRQAVKFSQFDELQRQESESGFKERAHRSTANFFRSGISGQGADLLSGSEKRDLMESGRGIMERLAYL